MIIYSSSSPWEYLRWTGSVAPEAVKVAVPSAAIAALFSYALSQSPGLIESVGRPSVSETTGWTLFTSILGFLLVFRAKLSYQRYWEGLTLVERGCAVWLNGCSNLIAFCSPKAELHNEVEDFQYILSRYMSLLVSYSMADVSRLELERFPCLALEGIDPESLTYLEATSAKQQVALQWVQRLVVEYARMGVVDIAPPILSRVFQEFSIGIVHFLDARKISNAPFPFAFAQMVWIMLVFFSVLVVPLICAVGMNIAKATIYTFLIVFVFWSVHYIAIEIELPFGDDPNDLPLEAICRRFNKNLERLLDVQAQQTMSLVHRPAMSVKLMKRDSTLVDEFVPLPGSQSLRGSIMGALTNKKSDPRLSDSLSSPAKLWNASSLQADGTAEDDMINRITIESSEPDRPQAPQASGPLTPMASVLEEPPRRAPEEQHDFDATPWQEHPLPHHGVQHASCWKQQQGRRTTAPGAIARGGASAVGAVSRGGHKETRGGIDFYGSSAPTASAAAPGTTARGGREESAAGVGFYGASAPAASAAAPGAAARGGREEAAGGVGFYGDSAATPAQRGSPSSAVSSAAAGPRATRDEHVTWSEPAQSA